MPKALDRIYTIAERQLGYFTTAQAEQEDVSKQLLQKHLRSGAIERETHGIYRLVNFPASAHEDAVVATLLVGPDAIVSHETALSIYDVGGAMPTAIHITTPHRFRTRRIGIVAHVGTLSDAEKTRRQDVPVTTIERTLVDVANYSDLSLLRDALREAVASGLTTPRRIERQLERQTNATLGSLLEELR